MGFVSRIFSSPSPQPAPAPAAPAPVVSAPAPVQAAAPIIDPAGDPARRDRKRGGAGARRGGATILTGTQGTEFGTTQGKTLLGQ